MTRSREPLPTSDRTWWVRFLAIAIATSGLCIALAVGLDSRPVPEADANTEKPSRNPSKIADNFQKQTSVKESDREDKPKLRLPGIFGNVASRPAKKAEFQPPEEPAIAPLSQNRETRETVRSDSEYFDFQIPFDDTPKLPEIQPKSKREIAESSSRNGGAIADSLFDGISLPPILQTPGQPVRNTAEALLAQTTPDSAQPVLELNQKDVVYLALQNNRTIRNQYLERIVQRRTLEVAEDAFVPDFIPSLSVEWQEIDQGDIFSRTSGLVLDAKLVMKIPTGGNLEMGWSGQGERLGGDIDAETELRQNLELSFEQPLLRGAGFDVNRAPIKIARLDEAINILELKQTLIEQITNAILAYRDLVQAQERLEIQIRSLEAARQQVENTQILIDAGRKPAIDLITVERGVTTQEANVLDAENNLERQQLALLNFLDLNLDETPTPVAVGVDLSEIEIPELEEVIEIAFRNNPGYLQAKLEVEKAETTLIVAENDRRWNIDFDADIRHDPAPNIVDERTEFRAGIVFSKTLGDLRIEEAFDRARVDVLQAKNNLDEERQQVNIDVTNAVREVRDNLRQWELAQRVTELREQELNNEEEKIRLGVGDTSVVELVRFQDALVEARNAELDAQIEYLNSLTRLEETVGTTLEQWEIVIEPE